MAVDELNAEQLFDDLVVVAAGTQSRWAHRHRVRLEELAEEWWVMSPQGTWNYEWVARSFKERDLGQPKLRIATYKCALERPFFEERTIPHIVSALMGEARRLCCDAACARAHRRPKLIVGGGGA